MAERVGNAWLSTAQYILDAYRERNQIEQAGGTYVFPDDGIMDDETYRIIRETAVDAINIERLYNTVTQGPNPPYKLFSFWQIGAQKVKQDIDYLVDTWGGDIRALGSWWNDSGIQGGMQPGENEGDPPTGSPFYPIPNNTWTFMPDIVEYDADGNEINRIPATSNADLRDVNLLLGQITRDFTQYGVFSVNQSRGIKNNPAIIQTRGGAVAGQSVVIAAIYERLDGSRDPESFTIPVNVDIDNEELAQLIAERFNNTARYNAVWVNDRVLIQPQLDGRSINIVHVVLE